MVGPRPPSRTRELDAGEFEARSAVGAVGDVEFPAVSLGHRSDDAQSEPGLLLTRRVTRFKNVVPLRPGDPRPVILDIEAIGQAFGSD